MMNNNSNLKIGNFVRHKRLGTVHEVQSINGGEFDDKITVTFSPSFDHELMEDYELWIPKKEEFVIDIFDVFEHKFTVKKVRKFNEELNLVYFYELTSTCKLENLKPFFGRVPKI